MLEETQATKNQKPGKRFFLIAILGMLALTACAVFAGMMAYLSILNDIPRAEHVVNSVSQEEVDAILNYNEDGIEEDLPVSEYTAEEIPVETETLPQTPSSEDVINVLLVGQAARAGETHRMADTMILVSVNTRTKVMHLTSFLRDTFVKLPNYQDLSGRTHTCGKQKLTVCYHLGSTFGGTADAMRMTKQCLLENFGVEVDHVIEVGFEGVIQIVDYFGGLEFDLTKAEAQYLDNDKNYPFPLPITEGTRVLDGTGTLAYARMRKAVGDGESDIKRTSRQRLVLQKLLEKVKQQDLSGMARLVRDFLPYVTTDMSNADITKCMAKVLPILMDLTVETGTCPVEGTYHGELIELGGQPASILEFNMAQNKKLMRRITEGAAE